MVRDDLLEWRQGTERCEANRRTVLCAHTVGLLRRFLTGSEALRKREHGAEQ